MFGPIAPIEWTPPFPTIQSKQSQSKIQTTRHHCLNALREAWKRFAFDKICYSACPSTQSSKHMALHHNCGNCYSFSAFLQHLLFQKYSIRSYIISGSVPIYYMLPTYKGICHAAVYVPEGEVLLDPSVYIPPVPLRFDGAPTAVDLSSFPRTIIQKYANALSAQVLYHDHTFRVRNSSNTTQHTNVPAQTFEVRVTLHKPPAKPTTYSYVLRGIQNFDQSVTNRVHSINKSLFRQATNEHGQFTHSLRFIPKTDKIMFKNNKTNKQTVMRVADKYWKEHYTWAPDEISFFCNIQYCL